MYDALYNRWRADEADRAISDYHLYFYIDRLVHELRQVDEYNQFLGHEALDEVKKLRKLLEERLPSKEKVDDTEEWFE